MQSPQCKLAYSVVETLVTIRQWYPETAHSPMLLSLLTEAEIILEQEENQ